jgi:hypothetical protein
MSMGRRDVSMICVCVLLIGGAFLFLHTGERAADVCMSERFAPSDGVSLWPPGARCSYGEPVRTDVVVNWWFVLVSATVLAGVVALRPGSARV